MVADDENLIGALALHLAGKKLYDEYSNESEIEPQKTNHKHQFQQKEQLLALHFLLRSFGINPLNRIDRTKLAALFHLILDVPFESHATLKNLAIYKNLKIVRKKGLEPPCRNALPPEESVFTNFTTCVGLAKI